MGDSNENTNKTAAEGSVAQGGNGEAAALPQNPGLSLFVGDLHPEVTETALMEAFSAVGPVASVRVCRDAVTRRSLGYAYVNYHNSNDASRAIESLNYTPLRSVPCRVMWKRADPKSRKSGDNNVFIKNLDLSIDNRALHDAFSAFGNPISCKVACDRVTGNSKGYGYVQYETDAEATQAIQKVDGMLLDGKKVSVSRFVPRANRSGPDSNFTNVYVKNIDTCGARPICRSSSRGAASCRAASSSATRRGNPLASAL